MVKPGKKRPLPPPSESGSESEAPDSDNESVEDLDPKKFADSLNKLKDTDPDFYNYLEENDEKLLNFNLDSDDENVQDEDDAEGSENEAVHKPDADLHGASDESDFEEEDKVVSSNKVTLKLIKEWQQALQSPGKAQLSAISNVIKAFHSALIRVIDVENDNKSHFIVEGSGAFNAIVQTCVLYLRPALKSVLGLQKSEKNMQKCKRWKKVKGILKMYFLDLIKLLGGVTSTNILNVLLKHLHQMSTFLGCYPNLAKVLFKRLSILWSSSEETVRVLAFLCILRVTSNNQAQLLDGVIKMMYMTYVKNSKFVSPSTSPGISFMRRSLIEILALDVNVSYQHVFLYIRQLAIHLRNAIVLHKKENIQVVYNWQFVNSLQLWAELISATVSKPQLQTLLYPLVMVITNTIKLNPTAQYFPLRFHCIKILINLSRDADVFIPILPFLLEVLTIYDFSKKHKKMSMKPLNFSCILRLSKSLMSENGFKDAVVENVYMLLLETLSLYSHTISFPDITIMSLIQLKKFVKDCKVANYSRKIRIVIDKIEENNKFIEGERKKIQFQLSDVRAIKAWETNVQNVGTPMQTYFDNLRKISIAQGRKKFTKNDELADKLPKIKKIKAVNGRTESEGPTELFPSDSEEDGNDDFFNGIASDEDDLDEEVVQKPPKKKARKEKSEPKIEKKNKKEKVKQKKVKKVAQEVDDDDDENDQVQDLNLVDW